MLDPLLGEVRLAENAVRHVIMLEPTRVDGLLGAVCTSRDVDTVFNTRGTGGLVKRNGLSC